MKTMSTPSANDGPRFHSDVPVSELTERDTRAIEASVISSAPPVVKTEDGVMHETWPTPTKLHGARGLEPPDPNSGIQLTGNRTELGEKTQISPSGLRPTHLEVDRVISTFSFDPNIEPSP